jgi:predicted cupin superfamily sugar epimerase
MLNAAYCITHLGLIPHPAGGYYKETYRSEGTIDSSLPDGISGPRSFSTGIYFLLEHGNFSAFHRIKSDEMWHFYAGDPLEVIEITPQGKLIITVLGNNLERRSFSVCRSGRTLVWLKSKGRRHLFAGRMYGGSGL